MGMVRSAVASGPTGFVAHTSGGETFHAYIPPALPPQPAVELSSLYALNDRALQALGRLDGLSRLLPDHALFLYMYVRKEALLSSQIEGTQSSLSELLLFESHELPGAPLDDVHEVSRYVAAMEHGLARLREGFPLSLRLIRDIHRVLLADGRGADKTPGEFRRTQNWVGGTRPGDADYVPPPPERLDECLGAFERFLYDSDSPLPILVRAAYAHVQFESIHPFLDGNGRLGRLLITFLLCVENVLREPLLYLSLYFKSNRARYYRLLQRVRTDGAWRDWREFFLIGVHETASQAADTATRILALFEEDRIRIESLGRSAASALRVHQLLQRKPYVSAPTAAATLNLSTPTVRSALEHLVKVQIVREVTGKPRNRVFVYRGYLDLLSEGTEPLPAGR